MTLLTIIIIILIIGLLISVITAFIIFTLREKRHLAAPQPPPKATLPICPVVLVHGVMGFDEMRIAGNRIEYFKGIVVRLKSLGITVYCPSLPPASSVPVRAQRLADYLKELPCSRVNLIAHSMGGLDARYAISHLGITDRILSLTTIGTPHHGTPLADLGTDFLGERLGFRPLLELFGLDVDFFYEFTRTRMAIFNNHVPNEQTIFYGSVVAAVTKDIKQINRLLLPSYLYLKHHNGENDGLVPRDSQQWGQLLTSIEADHWAQVGWSKYFDARVVYELIVRDLRGMGF